MGAEKPIFYLPDIHLNIHDSSWNGLYDPEKPYQDYPWITRQENRYSVLELIGMGGFGRVYKAYDNDSARFVAIKIIPTETPEGKKYASEIEAQVGFDCSSNKIGNGGTVEIYEYFRYKPLGKDGAEVGVIVEEYLDPSTYENLQTLIDSNDLTPKDALSIMNTLGETIDEAFNNGVAHRDLKPSNIFYSREHQKTKLTDFGISSPVASAIPGASRMGTTPFVAPERLKGEGKESIESEVYSLGVILRGMILEPGRQTVKPNFEALDLNQLRQILAKSIHIDPEQRYHRAKDFALAFQNAFIPEKKLDQNQSIELPSDAFVPTSPKLTVVLENSY